MEKEITINCVNPSPIDNLACIRLSVDSLKPITHIEDFLMREQAEELIDEVLEHLAVLQLADGDNAQAVSEGFAFVRHIQEMIEAFNAVTICVHCKICRSAFIGKGPTPGAANSEAFDSLASHTAKIHPVKS